MPILEDIDMPLAKGTILLHPERALLVFEGINHRIFIGQLCYLARNTSSPARKKQTFDEDSLSQERITAVRRIICILSDELEINYLRPITVRNHAQKIIEFLNWSDNNEKSSVLCDEAETEVALSIYFKLLNREVKVGLRKTNGTSDTQSTLKNFFTLFFENEDFGADLQPTKRDARDTKNSEIPRAHDQGIVIYWCQTWYKVITDLLLEFKSYPISIKSAPGHPDIVIHPLYYNEDANIVSGWDFKKCEVKSIKTLTLEYEENQGFNPLLQAKNSRASAIAMLREANSNRNSSIRMFHSAIAIYCFAALFFIELAMNLAQFLELPWSNELETNIDSGQILKQSLRRIKYRAKGRLVSFDVSLQFIPSLKLFLKLRKYILGGKKFPYLLVMLGRDNRPTKLNRDMFKMLEQRLREFGITLPHITSRQWRATKTHWVARNYGIPVAVDMAQHSLAVALKSYSSGTDTEHKSEMGVLYDAIDQIITRPRYSETGGKENGIGICKSFKQPEKIIDNPPVTPDCNSTEGCLFCNKHRAFSDEVDIRKILSCRFCVRLVSNRVRSMEHYEETYSPIIRRLDFLIEELRKREPALVAKVQEEVETTGELDPFWSNKLEMLIELGLA
ncbi:hypothetical protein SAMN05443245_4683 [Paraburkholderia fungorum]|uniref:Uncharacterized protein n=1 Tax=Paraburkholderia fungorum TaxID=134537 RepID=A0A1H1I675_9BURK|nr:hypothetical protein [Paraburkholderia fungorum]SDR32846.1 hypothetical protein SAMN05443245_4683 [Paraburkholderia fungorum]